MMMMRIWRGFKNRGGNVICDMRWMGYSFCEGGGIVMAGGWS